MKTYTVIDVVNGIGKSSFAEVLVHKTDDLGFIIDIVAILNSRAMETTS